MGCAVVSCGGKVLARGWCRKHYDNWRRLGDPICRADWDLEKLLMSYVLVVPSGCWEYQGCRVPKKNFDYGLFTAVRLGFNLTPVHRVAYEHWVGPIPEGEIVRHRCDNPPCFNPEHLIAGTHADNNRDMMERERHWSHKQTTCAKGHEFDKVRIVHGQARRRCSICENAAAARYHERKRAGIPSRPYTRPVRDQS